MKLGIFGGHCPVLFPDSIPLSLRLSSDVSGFFQRGNCFIMLRLRHKHDRTGSAHSAFRIYSGFPQRFYRILQIHHFNARDLGGANYLGRHFYII